VGQDVYIEDEWKRFEPVVSLIIKFPVIGLVLHECKLGGLYLDTVLLGIVLISQFPGFRV